ncbi:Trm112 family protein [Mesocricetibacter intestinalis]|uniref:Trm112 family protein n=1 Tax=Mesocricetibacter intestinalis TaxID=1521930 RepID=UPI00105EEED7|nr:Trm112 family protein [Mesocricetibacter intestinalis]
MDGRLLEIIACPCCQGRLAYDRDKGRLLCKFERIGFPIEKGIPVLLPEYAFSLCEDEDCNQPINNYSREKE